MTTRTPALILAAASLAALFAVASADTVELKDGRKISGTITRQADTVVIKTEDGTTISAQFAEVVHITLDNAGSTATSTDASQSQWSRIAIQIKQSSDLAAIIKLHQTFLTRNPDAPLAKDVGESLLNYQRLADSGGIKYHGQWMLPDQVDAAREQSAQAARPALGAYLAGHIKDSLDLATALLANDPENPDALAIAGLAAYRSGSIPLARKYFGALSDADTAFVLAQNNLAVISYHQKQTSETILHYTKALKASQDDFLLLNNIAEAINSYKSAGGSTASPNFRALVDHYSAAEATVEAQMAKVGMRRYGSTWVMQKQFENIAKNRQDLHDQLTLVEAQTKATSSAIAHMDAAADGALAGQRNILVSHLADLSGQHETLMVQLAQLDDGFSGEQQIMDLPALPDTKTPSYQTIMARLTPQQALLETPTAQTVPTPLIAQSSDKTGSTVSPTDPDQSPPPASNVPVQPYRGKSPINADAHLPPHKQGSFTTAVWDDIGYYPNIPGIGKAWHIDGQNRLVLENENKIIDPVRTVYENNVVWYTWKVSPTFNYYIVANPLFYRETTRAGKWFWPYLLQLSKQNAKQLDSGWILDAHGRAIRRSN